MQEHASAGHLAGFVGVGYRHGRLAYEPHVAVHAAVVAEVEGGLLLARRICLVVAVVGFDGYQAFFARLYAEFGQVDDYREIASEVAFNLLAVDENVLFAHYRLEIHGNVPALHVGRNGEVLAVPGHALVVAAAACLGRLEPYAVRCADHLPLAVVERCGFGSCGVAQVEAPALVEVVYYPSATLQRKQSCD